MTLQAYDSHCNLVLGDVEETIYVVEEDENEQETTRVGFPAVLLVRIAALIWSICELRRPRSKRRCFSCEVSRSCLLFSHWVRH